MFAFSIAMIFARRGKQRRLPVTTNAVLIIAVMTLGLLHPETDSMLAGIAAIGLNFAIIAPVFWVSKMRLRVVDLKLVLAWTLAFQLLSTAYGVLEVVRPATFSRQSEVTTAHNKFADGLRITLANGTRIYRPMGLTDTPGGACRSGFYTILLGSCFLFITENKRIKSILILGIIAGLFCIYITQVRSMLVLAGICELVLIGMFVLRGEAAKAITLATTLSVLAVLGTVLAFSIGGKQVSARVVSLMEGSARSIYYQHRGKFLEETIVSHIPDFPLGAGLGRWGMVNLYFGDSSRGSSRSLWAEIQPTGWVFDGGVPLLLAYYTAIVSCCLFAYRLALSQRGLIGILSMAVLAYDISILANTFSYVPFIGQAGLDFWLMNACLMTVVYHDASNHDGQNPEAICEQPCIRTIYP
ncbi:hypothetical protein SH528x_005495 [Novipirellula sp. SH528]|uniref:hypothetical protein n=1 Tax=Novipirellula sp. SH528 TaxID=3454466 RepID=UPI003F9FD7CA